MTGSMTKAFADLQSGICALHVWPTLGWQEVRQRYRRSVLGPFWLTVSTAVLVGSMGPLYGRLFNQDISAYFPYLAISFVIWQFLSNLIIESCQAFISAEGFIKQTKLPFSIHVLRVVWRNLIIFFHNLVIVAVVLFFFPAPLTSSLLFFPIGVALIAINGLWIGLLLGLLCARFRDIPPIVTSIVQVALFVTPIMWQPTMLGPLAWLVDWNPIYHFMEIVRAPLFGALPAAKSLVAIALITLGGYCVALAVFARFRARIAYWL